MLGLGLGVSKVSSLRSLAAKLLAKLKSRSTYYENNKDSKQVTQNLDTIEVLDKASILLTPTAYSDARVHSVKTYTGDELVTNGTFDTDSDWAKGTGWTIANGIATYDGTAGTSAITQADVIEVGKTYKVTIEVISNEGTGVNTIFLGGTVLNGSHLSVGTHTFYGATSNTNVSLNIYGRSGEVFQIDNVSIVDVSSDFDFDRASSATRINSDGLVQDMQSITDPELVLNGDFEELGDELVTNGTFDTDSDWTLGAGWSIEDGKAVRVASSSTDLVQVSVFPNLTSIFKITFDVVRSAGSVRLRAGTFNLPYVGATDTYTYYVTPTSNDQLKFQADSSFEGSIDNVSVQQVDPNDRWTLGTSWSIEDGVAASDGSGSYLTSSSTLTSGNTYRVSLEITEYNGGSVSLPFDGAGANTNYQNSVGVKTADIIAENNSPIYIYSSGFDGKIDNISVKDITFSEDVDLARINYDSNGENGHILLEPTSTNILPYSEDFSEWELAAVTVEGGYLAPDGSNNAYKVSGTVGSSSIYYQGVNATDTRTIWARTVSGTGTINLCSYGQNTNNNFTITEDWQRFEVNGTTTSTGGTNFYALDFRFESANPLSEVIIWGAQSEALSYATSYIPTYGSTVTRATETLNGSGNSTLINSTEGVLYAEIAAFENTNTDKNISISDGTATNRIGVYYYGNTMSAVGYLGGANQFYLAKAITDVKEFIKVAVKYKENDFALWIDGEQIATDTSGTVPSGLNSLQFDNGGGIGDFYGNCKALALFDEALTDTELQNLTS